MKESYFELKIQIIYVVDRHKTDEKDRSSSPYMVRILCKRSANLMSTTRGSSTMPKSITRKLLA